MWKVFTEGNVVVRHSLTSCILRFRSLPGQSKLEGLTIIRDKNSKSVHTV